MIYLIRVKCVLFCMQNIYLKSCAHYYSDVNFKFFVYTIFYFYYLFYLCLIFLFDVNNEGVMVFKTTELT
ncbi:hypothetical protein Xbud_01963 [Xenorhabdus budapestensis]|uniref:Uncharacterized protein n=1 Tax=Xenorhabdus budapestensis TaxID=290110 RepID=A0A2D0J0Y0_XENBU|nr:hypothetical protein Xbud_01963 [Xenorhabdus budapestensis]